LPWRDADESSGHSIEKTGAMCLDLAPDCVWYQNGLKTIQQVQYVQLLQLDQGTGIADNEPDDRTILRHASPSLRLRE
jgi:hypothetical protein